jgi:glycosyltransferase involved in cell wall biosynthesis
VGVEQLHQKADIPQLIESAPITNLMYLIWNSRKDLQLAFDIGTAKGQQGLVHWYANSVQREYGLNPTDDTYPKGLVPNNGSSGKPPFLSHGLPRLEHRLRRSFRWLPRPLWDLGKAVWRRVLIVSARSAARHGAKQSRPSTLENLPPVADFGQDGANLVGYAHAELGMGEHVRMSAAALETTNIKFGLVNFDVGVSSREKANLEYGESCTRNKFRVNVFHINADQMLKAYCHLGEKFFKNRYNIGYWAWELSNCPKELVPIIGLVDEIWAPSRFIQTAFADVTNKPVEYMPLCVTLPTFEKRSRAFFGLPERRFLFIFVFDFLSYIDRKNPFATIRAFQAAFPGRFESVGLVIKVMNGDKTSQKWTQMTNLIGNDHRIHIINQTLSRGDVLALIDVCDCFISLHRSEGFGRGPAEAMYLGKPVVVTNYSGNTDFTISSNSCLVDYRLISVEPHQYVFPVGQVWADVDVDHAAWHMRRLVENSALAKDVGAKGKEFIRAHFDPITIGGIYANRINRICTEK